MRWLLLFVTLVVPPAECLQVSQSAASQLFPIHVEDRWGYIDGNGDIAVEPRFLAAGYFREGLAIAAIPKKESLFPSSRGGLGYIDTTGTEVIPATYLDATDFSEGLAGVCTQEGDWIYVDRQGNTALDPSQQGLHAGIPFSEGLTPVGSKTGWHYMDKKGTLVIDATAYRWVTSFSEGLAAVQVREGLWGFIDKTGTLVIPPRFKGVLPFSEGLAPVQIDRRWAYIDTKGEIAISPKFRPLVSRRANVVIGVLQIAFLFFGQWLSSPPLTGYLPIHQFSEGLAAVHTGRNKWAYIDKSGEIVVESKNRSGLHVPGEFHHGLAESYDGEKLGWMNREGEYVWKPTKASVMWPRFGKEPIREPPSGGRLVRIRRRHRPVASNISSCN